MVFFSRLHELHDAYEPLIGAFNHGNTPMAPDAALAVRMANIQLGERVLDLGCGGGRTLVAAKYASGDTGLVVGLDGVKELLDTDATHTLSLAEYVVAPEGSLKNQVHLVHGSVTDGAIGKLLASKTGKPAVYDVIFLVHVFETIPPPQRRQALQGIKRMLSPGGRIVMSLSARFGTLGQVGNNTPVQFHTGTYNETPGCLHVFRYSKEKPKETASRGWTAGHDFQSCIQMAPDHLWAVAKEQATAMASNLGFHIVQVKSIGNGETQAPSASDPMTVAQNYATSITAPLAYRTEQVDGGVPIRFVVHLTNFESNTVQHSPSAQDLRGMTAVQITEWADQQVQAKTGLLCLGRAHESVVSKSMTTYRGATLATRNVMLATWLRNRGETLKRSIQQRQGLSVEHQQLGVMVELRE